MEPVGKLICGGLATVALGLVSHMAGTGEAVIDTLRSQSNAALAATGIKSVHVAFEQNPMRRMALLSGTADPWEKANALATVRALPGMMGVRWVDPKPMTTAVLPPPPAASLGPAQPMPSRSDAPVAPKPVAAPTPPQASANDTENAAPTPSAAAGLCQAKVNTALGGREITFRAGSPWVNLQAREMIADVVKALSACPKASLLIGGHADPSGTDVVNQKMSQARADAVRDVLVAKGFPAGRIATRGYGSAPAKGGSTTNRRISFTVNGG